MIVYSRGRSGSGALVPVPGLIGIPRELHARTHELVAALNRREGWIKYQAL